MSLVEPAPKVNTRRQARKVKGPFTCSTGEVFDDLLDALACCRTHVHEAHTKLEITSANGVLMARWKRLEDG